jgi:hypothetical protein
MITPTILSVVPTDAPTIVAVEVDDSEQGQDPQLQITNYKFQANL